jgi:acetate kinase
VISPTPAGQQVLVLNCGSSSVKFALLEPHTGRRRLTGLAERVGGRDASVSIERDGREQPLAPGDGTHHAVVAALLGALTDEEHRSVAGIGHRVVHGGRTFTASVLIDDAVLSRLRELVSLAPLHMPANVAGIEAAVADFGHLPQAAVFDTAFHQTLPPVAYRYAVPRDWYTEHHVRRYGFHGTSHRFVSARAAEFLGRPLTDLRMITLHLGNGCSAAAIKHGESVDTTMGLTPLEGLVMGTRSGDIDASVVGYMSRRLGLDLDSVLEVLNTQSGLLGLSGQSNDMRTLAEAADGGSAEAALAIDVFCYRAAKAVGALAVALGELDVLVFTGGIGEHSPVVRAAVLDRLQLLGLRVDRDANGALVQAAGRVSTDDSAVVALVVPTDEERLIGLDTLQLAGAGRSAEPDR